jgi:diacylglycerol kinase (ATP)
VIINSREDPRDVGATESTTVERMTKHLLFWNGNSGRAERVEKLRLALHDVSTTWVELNRETDLHSEIERALENGCEVVVAAGGDGTVNAVVNAIMKIDENRRPCLAIVPLGTANDFAGTLAIPDGIQQSIDLFQFTNPTPIDMVRISGENFERYYANVAAGGNCVRVSEQLTAKLKNHWGPLSYARGSVNVLADMNTYRITVDIESERFEGIDCWAVLVANGRTNAGRIVIAPKASPQDGMLDIVIIKNGNLMDMVEIVAANLSGNFLECEQIIFRQAKCLRLCSDPPMRFTLDGELIDEEPLEFNIIAGAIRAFTGHCSSDNSPHRLSIARPA